MERCRVNVLQKGNLVPIDRVLKRSVEEHERCIGTRDEVVQSD